MPYQAERVGVELTRAAYTRGIRPQVGTTLGIEGAPVRAQERGIDRAEPCRSFGHAQHGRVATRASTRSICPTLRKRKPRMGPGRLIAMPRPIIWRASRGLLIGLPTALAS